MTWVNHNDYAFKREYYEDQAREAAHARLIRQVRVEPTVRRRVCCAALVWAGRRMVAWGQRLQERYSTAAPAPQSV
jgi:hypothetical protein